MKEKRYIGDAVYIVETYGGFWLTTEDGTGRPSNEIFIELDVYKSLKVYVEQAREAEKATS